MAAGVDARREIDGVECMSILFCCLVRSVRHNSYIHVDLPMYTLQTHYQLITVDSQM